MLIAKSPRGMFLCQNLLLPDHHLCTCTSTASTPYDIYRAYNGKCHVNKFYEASLTDIATCVQYYDSAQWPTTLSIYIHVATLALACV